jgi:transglutaminase-like putative cysteine protease
MTILEVRHTTVYRYRRPVRFGEHRAMFRPRDSHDLRVLDTELIVSPLASVRWMHDVFSNSITVLGFGSESSELRLESRIRVAHYGPDGPDYLIDLEAETYPFDYGADDLVDLGTSRLPHYPDPDGAVAAWAHGFVRPGVRTLDLLTAMNRAIHEGFAYEVRHEHGTRPPAETLARGSGSCRDFALLLMEAARALGLGARFVSGYLYDPALDGGGTKLQGAGATHAWAQIYLPSAGWVELDPTNGIVGGRNLIRVAVARDPRQAIPVSGSYFGSGDDFLALRVEVEVRRVGALPR